MYLGEPQAGRFDSAGYRQWPPLRNIIAHFQILSIIFCKENASRRGSTAKKVRFTESFAGKRLTPTRIRAKMQKKHGKGTEIMQRRSFEFAYSFYYYFFAANASGNGNCAAQ